MAVIVDRLVADSLGYSMFEMGEGYGLLTESALKTFAVSRKTAGRSLHIPRQDPQRGTGMYFRAARALADYARDHLGRPDAVAILFRDGDGSHGLTTATWQAKRNSIRDGFTSVSFDTGVPMVPRPKSEAWLLCHLQPQPYQNCEQFEGRSGNDGSPNSLKAELDRLLPDVSAESLCDLAAAIDLDRLGAMPSFDAFRKDLASALRQS